MSGAIGPGDWVEVIKPGAPGDPAAFPRGSVWRVDRVFPDEGLGCSDDWRCAAGSLSLSASPGPWCACGFRPIYRPRAVFIEQLKQPAPELEPA